jgi:hypothetical protein
MYKISVLCLGLVLLAAQAWSSDHVLYFEGQEILGYSSALGKTIPYSVSPDAEMQKPSVGFDYLGRFSGESGDIATLSLQYRLALTKTDSGNGYKTENQVYNAYVRARTPLCYVWIGHNRPAFGLSSYLDSHGLLLPTLEMRFGYDRDWGIGANKDYSWGDISISETIGSGMPLRETGDNYMSAARASYGVLSRDNFNLGFSLSAGRTLDTTGYTILNLEPQRERLAGIDLTFLRDNLEHRFDLLGGQWLGKDLEAFFYRFGMNLDDEGRYKIEAQPEYWKSGEKRDYQGTVCFSLQATSNTTIRMAYIYDHLMNDNRYLLQLYFYEHQHY